MHAHTRSDWQEKSAALLFASQPLMGKHKPVQE
jgi:hypothetical protein